MNKERFGKEWCKGFLWGMIIMFAMDIILDISFKLIYGIGC